MVGKGGWRESEGPGGGRVMGKGANEARGAGGCGERGWNGVGVG